MPNQHKNPGISWHPADSTLKEWVKDRAARTGVTVREYEILLLLTGRLSNRERSHYCSGDRC